MNALDYKAASVKLKKNSSAVLYYYNNLIYSVGIRITDII